LKNQLLQAIAAIQFADENERHLRFHINSSRQEQGGSNVYKNLVALFKNTTHELVEHTWMPHDTFLSQIQLMDISMQVSMTETFNIVTADAVSLGVPVVASSEVDWLCSWCQAEPMIRQQIVDAMYRVTGWAAKFIRNQNYKNLQDYSAISKSIWTKYLILNS
jgi:hypothetical protein